jgi:hypothetical protein
MSLGPPTHHFGQRPPDEHLTRSGAARHQRTFLLTLKEDFAHQGPGRAAGLLPSGRLRVPVQEGEAEGARQRERPVHQAVPEGEERLAEVYLRGRTQLRGGSPFRRAAEVVLAVRLRRLGKGLLAAIAPVQRAHRHARHPGQLLRRHVVVAAQPQHLRHVAHHPAVVQLQQPHPPSPSPTPPGGPLGGRNVPSANTFYRRGLTWVG